MKIGLKSSRHNIIFLAQRQNLLFFWNTPAGTHNRLSNFCIIYNNDLHKLKEIENIIVILSNKEISK